MANDLVLTPGGFRPRSQVHHVPPNHLLRMDGRNIRLLRRDGEFVRDFGRIDLRPEPSPLMPLNLSVPEDRPRHTPGVAPSAHVDGWVAYTEWANNSGQPISFFSSSWVVPDEPSIRADQTIFIFNSMQNSNVIYQPVLQWGSSAAGGGPYWSVASWYLPAPYSLNNGFVSSLVQVNVGDTLTGVMTLVAQNGAAFDYSCGFQGIANTTLAFQGVPELTWANVALEVYDVTDCGHYPRTDEIAFFDINLQTGTAAPNLHWSVKNVHPGCGIHAQVVNGAAQGGLVTIRIGCGKERRALEEAESYKRILNESCAEELRDASPAEKPKIIAKYRPLMQEAAQRVRSAHIELDQCEQSGSQPQ